MNDLFIIDLIRYVIGIAILLIGFGTIGRAMVTFGFDYMTVVYLYFPEESQLQNYKIYSILRHPTYAGLIYISFAGFLIQFSIYSLIAFIFYLIGFWIHIHFVEEKELYQRFGDSFKQYCTQVPAIFVRIKQLGDYFKFIIGKEQ
jgi:protein-S-isoprenylcysteine O-methyltransferase Ste14